MQSATLGSETWAIGKTDSENVEAFEMWIWTKLANISGKDLKVLYLVRTRTKESTGEHYKEKTNELDDGNIPPDTFRRNAKRKEALGRPGTLLRNWMIDKNQTDR